MKVSCWAIEKNARGERWEVAHRSADGKGCGTAIFSGPDAQARAKAYAASLATPDPDDGDDIEDLLA